MDKKTKNILSSLFWVAVAAVLVCFCLRSIDWEQFAQALRLCRWGYVLLSMVLGALVLYIRGNRWRMMLLPIDPSTSRITTFNTYNIGMAVNLAIPRAGEVVKLGYLVKHSGTDRNGKRLLSFDKALGTLITERLWDALIVGSLGIVLVVMLWDSFGTYLMENLSGSGGNTPLLWLLAVALVLLAGIPFLAYALRRKVGIWAKIWNFLAGIGDGLASFLKMKRVWLFLTYTVLIWGIYWLMSACIVWALQDIEAFAQLDIRAAFILMIAGSVSSVVPVPGGFGAYHGLICGALLSIWGIPMGMGMVYATLNHESQVITQALCGLGSYLHETFFRR